jgi:CheY-like chemotaxis protein
MEGETRIWQARELFDEIKSSGLGDFNPRALTVNFPGYLPPLVVAADAKAAMIRALQTIRDSANGQDRMLVTAYYEDHRDPGICCVVLSVQLQRPGLEESFWVENAWLEQMGEVSQILLECSVDLSLASADSWFNFDFRIPVYRSGTKARHHRDAVLIVEDDDFVRNSTREVLEMAGHRVLVAASSEEAWEVFDRNRSSILLVITDMTLPGASGKDLVRRLRATELRLPVLLMSGYASVAAEDVSQGIHFLAKPYNAEALIIAVRTCLQANHSASMPWATRGSVQEQAIGFY